ncbi:hypothetical protein ACVR0A_04920 [Streptococcus downei]|uniref:Uncharacterized protein n=1 Tax=Streptococcus downei MFe28 TaxID=764290 RepID=A0A380JC77_STRDO|nr:hypothetical protein [Streptococcus downei]EFQ58258.1 hypothetical protein HMPREF9176_0643 [Streptococcus downei F0415]SUN35254.1 Uncharacterised protein [Streptococcus downei MFe28]
MKNQVCAYCGGDQFVVKQQVKGYAGLVNEDAKFFTGGLALYHEICKNCGTVGRSFVKDVEKL